VAAGLEKKPYHWPFLPPPIGHLGLCENIPDKLRNAFKAHCAMKGSDMRTELLAYMEKVTAVAAKRSKR